jgi:hypothetical protein
MGELEASDAPWEEDKERHGRMDRGGRGEEEGGRKTGSEEWEGARGERRRKRVISMEAPAGGCAAEKHSQPA